jgi:hypothetical protein
MMGAKASGTFASIFVVVADEVLSSTGDDYYVRLNILQCQFTIQYENDSSLRVATHHRSITFNSFFDFAAKCSKAVEEVKSLPETLWAYADLIDPSDAGFYKKKCSIVSFALLKQN